MNFREKFVGLFGSLFALALLIVKAWQDRSDVEDAIYLSAILILVVMTVIGSSIVGQLAKNGKANHPKDSSSINGEKSH